MRAVVTANTMTSATQGAKGRQSPGFFTDLNKRWRLPLVFVLSRRAAARLLRLKFWPLNVFSGPA